MPCPFDKLSPPTHSRMYVSGSRFLILPPAPLQSNTDLVYLAHHKGRQLLVQGLSHDCGDGVVLRVQQEVQGPGKRQHREYG